MIGGVKKAWLKRTILERILLTVTVILTLIVISLIITAAVKSKGRKGEEYSGPVCRSSGCENLSNALRSSMDPSADPCEDFYAYSCGGWIRYHQVPSNMRQYGLWEMLREDILLKLKALLSGEVENSINSTAVEKALQLYHSCIDIDAIEALGNRSMIQLLQDIGGWPVADVKGRTSEAYQWQSELAKIQLKTGYGFIISVIVRTDPKNTSAKIIQLDKPNLILPRNVVEPPSASNQTEIVAYRNFFRNISVLLGAKVGERLNNDFMEIVQFERDLVQMMKSEENSKDGNSPYNKITLSELQAKIPQVEWILYLQALTNSTFLKLSEDSVITGNDSVLIGDLQYLQNVSKYMLKYTEQQGNIRQVANYLGWTVILSRISFLPARFDEVIQNYTRERGFEAETPEKWKACTSLVNSAFAHVSSLLYVRNYFQRSVRHEVSKLVEDLRFQFGELLDESDWMDSATKKPANQKLSAMKANVGYPDWIADEEHVDEYYNETGMPEMTGNVFEDELAITQQDTMNVIITLRKPYSRRGWPISPITVNAAYNGYLNTITFPAAFLQWPMYSRNAPEYYNFATIGSVIGHEITHGFDNEGRHRDGDGHIRNWWSINAEQEFHNRSQCFIDQYNAYGANGVKFLAENIADNGGLRQSYQAFLRWKEGRDVELLPQFENFTPEQLFFLSYGSMWCTNYGPDAINSTFLHSDHPPSFMRLRGSVSNMKQFAEAFNCKATASHNPQKRCVIW